MTDLPSDVALIYLPDPEPLRDYFRRLGAEAELEEGGVRVRYSGDGSADDTVAVYLRSWVQANNRPVSVLFDPPPPVPLIQSRVETAPTPARDLFREQRPPRLGDLLEARGLITSEQLELALAESRANGDLLGRVLIRRRLIFGDELARTLADQLNLPYVNLKVIGFDRSVAQLVPSSVGMRFAFLPIGRIGGRVRVAFSDPLDEEAKATASEFLGEHTVAVADLLEIELAWRTIDPHLMQVA